MRTALLSCLLAAAGCSDTSTGSHDDLSRPRDLGGARDFATGGGDLAMGGGDLAGAADLAMGGGDLAGADLGKGSDLSIIGGKDAGGADLAGVDLAKGGDLAVPSDLAVATDLGVTKDAASPPDLVSLPPVPLVTGGVTLFGVTSDGYAIYGDLTTNALSAVPVSGAAQPTVIDADYTLDDTFVDGKVVFMWQNVANGTGRLRIWTAAVGAKVAANASIDGVASARPDGALITFTANVNNLGTTADLIGATTDLVTAKKLVMGVGVDPNVCQPVLAFAAMRAVATTCAPGATAGTLSSWDGNWTKVDLLQNAAQVYDTNDSGKLIARDATANLSVFPLAGGAGTKIAAGVGFQLLSSDGSAAIYRDTTMAGALWRSPTVNPAPAKLVAMNVHALVGLSPDSTQVLFIDLFDQATGGSDLYLASATAAGAPTPLDANTDALPGAFGDLFTADSSHVLYVTGVDFASTLAGTLFTKPVAGGAATQQGTNVWWAWAGLGTKVVFNDNYTAAAGSARGDLKIVDAAGGLATLLHAQADVDMFLTFDKKQVVFADNVSMNSAGLYVQTLP